MISIAGRSHWLWRAVDQDGFVLDMLVQSRRDAKAAKRLMRKMLKGRDKHRGWCSQLERDFDYGRIQRYRPIAA